MVLGYTIPGVRVAGGKAVMSKKIKDKWDNSRRVTFTDIQKMSPSQRRAFDKSLDKLPPLKMGKIGCGVCKPFVIGQDDPSLLHQMINKSLKPNSRLLKKNE